MATAPSALPPPPDVSGAPSPAAVNPTTPTAASPAPPTPSPQMDQGTQLAIAAVTSLRAIAKAFPATAEKVTEANNIMREIMALMMSSQQTGETQAPPIGG